MIILDYRDTRPLYEQIVDKFQMLILSGALEPNSRMPSVRSLAVELSINPNTIQRAYSELERNGFLYTVKGKGNYVAYSDSLKDVRKQEILEKLRDLKKEALSMGMTVKELTEFLEQEDTAAADCLFHEVLPLSLEEIFISETEVQGYDIKKIVLG